MTSKRKTAFGAPASDAQCYLYEGLVQPVVKEYPGRAPHDHQLLDEAPADGGVRKA